MLRAPAQSAVCGVTMAAEKKDVTRRAALGLAPALAGLVFSKVLNLMLTADASFLVERQKAVGVQPCALRISREMHWQLMGLRGDSHPLHAAFVESRGSRCTP